jgi:hypothetical protein
MNNFLFNIFFQNNINLIIDVINNENNLFETRNAS